MSLRDTPVRYDLLTNILAHSSMAMVYAPLWHKGDTFSFRKDEGARDDYDLTQFGIQFYPLEDLNAVVGRVIRPGDGINELSKLFHRTCPAPMTHSTIEGDLLQRLAPYWSKNLTTSNGVDVMDWFHLDDFFGSQLEGMSRENLDVSEADIDSVVGGFAAQEGWIAAQAQKDGDVKKKTVEDKAIAKLKRDMKNRGPLLTSFLNQLDRIVVTEGFCSPATYGVQAGKLEEQERIFYRLKAGLTKHSCLDAEGTSRREMVRPREPHHHTHHTAPATPRTTDARRLPGRSNYRYDLSIPLSLPPTSCLCPRFELVPCP